MNGQRILWQPDHLQEWYHYIGHPQETPQFTHYAQFAPEPCLQCGEMMSGVWGRSDAICTVCGQKKECC